MIYVTGISKSGKTSLIKRLAALAPPFFHFSPSDILRAHGLPTVALAMKDVIPNQIVVFQQLMRQATATNLPIIVDGHLIIETKDGPQFVPDSFLENLPLSLIVHVRAAPELVSQRRRDSALQEDSRIISNLDFIEYYNSIRLSLKLGVKHLSIKDNDDKILIECLKITRQSI